jgi:hypothetical protein
MPVFVPVPGCFYYYGSVERINKTKNWFMEKISKIEKPLTQLTKRKREDPS